MVRWVIFIKIWLEGKYIIILPVVRNENVKLIMNVLYDTIHSCFVWLRLNNKCAFLSNTYTRLNLWSNLIVLFLSHNKDMR